MSDHAQAFADHLNELEASGNVDRFVSSVFREDAELVRPEAQQQLTGDGGAHTFWQQYLAHSTPSTPSSPDWSTPTG